MLRAKCDNVDILFNSDNVGTKVTFLDPGKAIDIFEMRNVLLTIKMLFIDESPVSLYLKKSDEKTSIPLTIRISDSENKNNKKIFFYQLLQ